MSKAARSVGVMRRAGKLFDCSLMLRAVSMHMFVQPRVLCRRVDVVYGVSFEFTG